MACEKKDAEINGREYSTVQLSPTKALALEARVYPILLGGIAPLVSTWGKGDSVQLEAIQQATHCLSESLQPKEFVSLIVDLCQLAWFDGKQIKDFDAHFSEIEDPTERYRVAFFILEANLGGFIDALGLSVVAGKARKAMSNQMLDGISPT